MKIVRPQSRDMERILSRFDYLEKRRVKERVAKILNDVRLSGDAAVTKYTWRFDQVRLAPRQMRITESEKSAAYQDIKPEFITTLKRVFANITKFYSKQLMRSWRKTGSDGITLGEKIDPLDRVGVYVPAGTAPLVSCVFMSVLPARIAGVQDIVLVTPPDKNGHINSHILVVADLLKVQEIYRVGGAQAIGALAYGTKTIRRVEKIVGPGNNYVTEAKRQVFGYVDIDMLAGPTELVVIANRHSDLNHVLADLRAQAEHLGGFSILLTPSKQLARQVKQAMPHTRGCVIVLVKNIEEAIAISNRLAPEHLEILTPNPRKWVKRVKNAGALFLGPFSPAAVGDYYAGPSHVLPTCGTARFFSGLSANDFLRSTHIISYSKKALEEARPHIERLCQIEGLDKHYASVKQRFE